MVTYGSGVGRRRMVMGARGVRMAFAPGFGIRPGFVTAIVGGETCREVETEGLGVGIECPLTGSGIQLGFVTVMVGGESHEN